MGVEREEVQIRIGLSLKGVEESKREATSTESRMRKVKTEVVQQSAAVQKIEDKLAHVRKDILKQGAKAFLASELTEGFNQLLGVQEANAWTQLGAQTGQRVGVGWAFGGKYGAFLGGMMAAVEVLKTGFEELREEVKSEREKARDLRQFAEDVVKKMQGKLNELDNEFTKLKQKNEDRLYLELRNG